MSGSKLSVAREVTYELGDWRPLLDEGGEIQEVIVIGEEVGTDGAIDVEVGVQVGVGEAASVGEPRCSMGVEGDKGVQVGSGGEALKARLGLENGQRRHGRGNMGTTKGEVPWAPLGEHTVASAGARHGLVSALVNGRYWRDLRCWASQEQQRWMLGMGLCRCRR
ncbi:unnamed protein product [Ilex paraguariensis]|uniref:Uncharacterized protein n=1 Tax=Ilex paraguariensis TaxID=185542 RepID=A0ABC8SZI8_9AQUA